MAVVGQVHLNRDDGDITVIEGPFVGIGCVGFDVVEAAGQPIVISASGVLSAVEFFPPIASVLATGEDSFDFVAFQVGDIDVDTEGAGGFFVQDTPDNLGRESLRGGEIGLGIMAEDRQADRRDIVKTSFDSGGHGSGVEYIDRGVRTVVNAGEDQLRHFVGGHQAIEGDFYAVDGGSATGIDFQVGFFLDFGQEERLCHGDGMRHTALPLFGSHHQQTSERADDIDQATESFGLDAVIVCDKDKGFSHK